MVTSINMLERGDLWEVTFDLGGFSQEGRRVVVTGSFNGWATHVKRSRNGFVEHRRRDNAVKFRMGRGVHEYKYYDLAQGAWLEAEDHPELYRGFYWDYVRNSFGTMNCVIRIPQEG